METQTMRDHNCHTLCRELPQDAILPDHVTLYECEVCGSIWEYEGAV